MRSSLTLPLLLVLLAAGCAHSDKRYLLEWAPENPPQLKAMDRTGLFLTPLRVEFADERQPPLTRFARHRSGDEFHTDQAVVPWMAGYFNTTLAHYGVRVVESGETATLRISVRQFGSEEGHVYAGNLNCVAQLFRPGVAQPVWAGPILGSSRRWGRSRKMAYHYEVLTRTVQDGVRNLLQDPGFLRALGPQAVPLVLPSVPAPPPVVVPAAAP